MSFRGDPRSIAGKVAVIEETLRQLASLRITDPLDLRAMYQAKGDVLVADSGGVPQRLGIGSDGDVATVDRSSPLGVVWRAPSHLGLDLIHSKGDLIVGLSAGQATTLGIGTSGDVLTAESSSLLGMAWGPVPSGGAPGGPAGGDLTGTYPNPAIAVGAVTSAKIADGTISDVDISAGAAIAVTKVVTTTLAHLAGIETFTGAKTFSATVTLTDGVGVAVGTTTGSLIGTTSAQKLGFLGTGPVAQQTTGTPRDVLIAFGLATSGITEPGGLTGFAVPTVTLSTAAAAGAATTTIRSDSTIAAFDATVPTTSATGDAAAAGAVNFAARRDHLHGREAQVAGNVDVVAGMVTQGFRAATLNPPLNIGTGAITAGASSLAATTVTTLGTAGDITMTDGNKIITGTTTGLMVGSTSAQKLGVLGTAPVLQQTSGTPRDVLIAFGFATSGIVEPGGITGFAVPAIVLGTAAAAGAATTTIRSDSTIVAFDATAPTTSAVGDAAAVGVVALAARRDHVHGRESFGAVNAAANFVAVSVNGTALTPARSDHVHGVTQTAGATDVLAGMVTQGLRAASSNPPLNLGTGALTAGATTLGGGTATTQVSVDSSGRMSALTSINADMLVRIGGGSAHPSTATTVNGTVVNYNIPSTATAEARFNSVAIRTAAASFTTTDVEAYYVDTPVLGASSAITNLYGLRVINQGQAGVGTVYGVYVQAQSGAGTTSYGGRFDTAQGAALWLGGNTTATDVTGGLAMGSGKDVTIFRSAASQVTIHAGTVIDAGNMRVDSSGRMATGGASVNVDVMLNVLNAQAHPSVASTAYGIVTQPTYASTTTASGFNNYAQVRTAAAAFTLVNGYSYFSATPNIGASSAITNNHGFYAAQQGNASINTAYGFRSEAITGSTTGYGARFDTAPTAALWLGGDTTGTTVTGGMAMGSGRDVTVFRSGTTALTLGAATSTTLTGDLVMTDAKNIVLTTTTGQKIGTGTTQKLGFWNATPIVQPSRAGQLTDNSGGASGGATIALVAAAALDATAADLTTTRNAVATLAAKYNLLEAKLSAAGGGSGITA